MAQLTVLGGSSIAVPELIDAIIPYMGEGRRLRIMLHGRDAHKLQIVARVSQQMASAAPGLTVEVSTNLEAALTGADYVLNQVRVGGLDARAYDEAFPHRWNIPGDETVGPGGAANALRTVPTVLELCQTIERVAPHSVLLSFSNPSSVVQRAVSLRTRLKVIGLCDVPYTMHQTLAQTLGISPERLDTQYVGMHHFGWITSARADGIERLSEALADGRVCAALGLDLAIGQIVGALPHSYFRYFFHPDRMLAKQRGVHVPRARELQQLEAELLAIYAQHQGAHKPEAVARRSAIWYAAVVAPTVAALAFGEPARLALNLTNEGRVPELPADTIIEITADIRDRHITAPTPRRLPPPAMLGMLQANAAYEQTLVEAILNDSHDLLLLALLQNPMVPSYDVAREVLEEIWPRRGWPPPA